MIMRTTIMMSDKLWQTFLGKAIKKFGHYGGISKGIQEAVEDWVSKN